jgi:hypothetical protein
MAFLIFSNRNDIENMFWVEHMSCEINFSTNSFEECNNFIENFHLSMKKMENKDDIYFIGWGEILGNFDLNSPKKYPRSVAYFGPGSSEIDDSPLIKRTSFI